MIDYMRFHPLPVCNSAAILSACTLATWTVDNLWHLTIFLRTQDSDRWIKKVPDDSDGCFSWFGEMISSLPSRVARQHTLRHDDVIKWRHFPRYWPFVRGIHRWIPLTKASDAELWCFLWSALQYTVVANNREAGDSRRHRAHYDVTVMQHTKVLT